MIEAKKIALTQRTVLQWFARYSKLNPGLAGVLLSLWDSKESPNLRAFLEFELLSDLVQLMFFNYFSFYFFYNFTIEIKDDGTFANVQ